MCCCSCYPFHRAGSCMVAMCMTLDEEVGLLDPVVAAEEQRHWRSGAPGGSRENARRMVAPQAKQPADPAQHHPPPPPLVHQQSASPVAEACRPACGTGWPGVP